MCDPGPCPTCDIGYNTGVCCLSDEPSLMAIAAITARTRAIYQEESIPVIDKYGGSMQVPLHRH